MVVLSMSVHTSVSPVTGLRKLLKASPPPPSPRTSTPRAPFERLPTSIIHDIGRQSDLRDVLHLSLCSHRLSRILAPVLYSSVELTTNRHCKNTLIALAKRPDLMQHVRRLVVQPNCVQWTDPGDEMDENLVATLVAHMTESMKALEVFEWDGMEMPGPELWAALKASCRNLKRIGTSLGEDPLDPSSPLWDFDDLRQFSLRVKCHSLDWIADGLPKPEKLPRRFWEMILERSPRLEELTLSSPSPSPRMFDIRHITSGRWSRLRSITLGDHVLVVSDNNRDQNKDKRRNSTSTSDEEQSRKDRAAFMAFFIHHPNLRTIRLEHSPGSAFFPAGFDFDTECDAMRTAPGGRARRRVHALPNVEEFAGPIAWVRTLPVKQRLRRLRVVGMHHSYYGYGYADSGVAKTCRVLVGLRWLEELSVWIDLSFGGGAGGAVASGGTGETASANGRRASVGGESETGGRDDVNMEVVNKFLVSRPGLKHLEISCFTRPSFSIKDFSTIIQRSAPTLQSFTLTKVHKSGDEEKELTRLAAAKIAIDNPRLRRFILRVTVDSWFSPGFGFDASRRMGMGGVNAGGRVRQLGIYEVLEAFDVPLSYTPGGELYSEGRQEDEEDVVPLNYVLPQDTQPLTQSTVATALFVREWGQKSRTTPTRIILGSLGFGHTSRCYVHPLNPSTAAPSANLASRGGISPSSRSSLGSVSGSNSSPSSNPSSTSGCGITPSLPSPPASPVAATHGANQFPPSSWQMHMSIRNRSKRHSHSHSRSLPNADVAAAGRTSPLSFSLTRSRSPSPSPSFPTSLSAVQNVGWRPRRASCSSVPGVEGYGLTWEGGQVLDLSGRAGLISSKSSFSSSWEPAESGSGCVPVSSLSGGGRVHASGPSQTPNRTNNQNQHSSSQGQNSGHPGQITWAESVENKGSLGRSGSSSTGGSSGSAYGSSLGCSVVGPGSQAHPRRRSRAKSLSLGGFKWGIGKSKGKKDRRAEQQDCEREMDIEEGYILV